MKSVSAAAIGTYYPPGAEAAGANASPMRGLLYLVKANRMPPAPNWLEHPRHPSGKAQYLTDQAAACSYIAEILEARIDRVRQTMGWGDRRLAFVPLPASKITRETMRSGRWPGRELAAALARRRLGVMRICVVNAEPREPKHATARVPAEEIARNTVVLSRVPSDELPIYVDDAITKGDRIAGTDHVLCGERPAWALAVAFAEGVETHDCYTPRKRTIWYDASQDPWTVSIVNG